MTNQSDGVGINAGPFHALMPLAPRYEYRLPLSSVRKILELGSLPKASTASRLFLFVMLRTTETLLAFVLARKDSTSNLKLPTTFPLPGAHNVISRNPATIAPR